MNGAEREPGACPIVDLGARLRAAREARGFGVEQVAAALRVRAGLVRALESGSAWELPRGPYARGFVDSYAAFLALDPGEIAALRERCATVPEAGADARRVFRYPQREGFNWRNWTIPLGFAAALLLLAVARTLLGPGAEPLPEPSPVPVIAELAVTPPVAEEAADPAAGAAAVEPEQPPAVRILMRSEGATWVTASIDGGEERRYDLGPGRNLELTARERIAATLGDAGLVRIRAGDRELGFVGLKGETRRGLLFLPPVKGAAAAAVTDGGAGD